MTWSPQPTTPASPSADTLISIEVIAGSPHDDAITGDSGVNVLRGHAGNDELYGRADADQLFGNAGNDQLFGGDGNDTLAGGTGDDFLEGGPGADTLGGSDGSDTASYASAAAAVTVDLATPANNTGDAQGDTYANIEIFVGSAYDDNLAGNASANALRGNAGNDTLSGRAGADTLDGNAGNDTLEGGPGADALDGGDGNDTADYSASNAGVSINLESQQPKVGGHAAGDTLRNIENLIGTSGGDLLHGNSAANVLRGGGGLDNIHGLGGDDELHGGPGNDAINGNAGNDTLEGGPGRDTLNGGGGLDIASYAGASAAVTVDLATPANNTGDAAGDTYTGIESILGSRHADTLNGGDANANSLNGNAGNDTLNGNAGDDTLEGGPGADTLNGGDGSDSASYAGASAAVNVDLATPANNTGDAVGDTFVSIEGIIGSAYDDTLTSAGNGKILEGGPGADALNGISGPDTASYANAAAAVNVDLANPANNTGDAQGDTFASIEILLGSAHDDTLTGDADNNILEGGPGADTLDGGDGEDFARYARSGAGVIVNLATGNGIGGDAQGDVLRNIERLHGSTHDDILTGDGSDNHIWGDEGDDSLNGRAGNDTLYGNEGNDDFRFTAGFGNDAITDYTLGASTEDSEIIRVCMGTTENPPTYAGADGSNGYVITVTFEGATAGTITLWGITAASPNFGNLNVQVFTANLDGSCNVPLSALDAQSLQVWFIDNTPKFQFVTGVGRIFMKVGTNRNASTANCSIGGGSIACPQGTLISLEATDDEPGDKYTVSATASTGGETAKQSHELVVGGPRQPLAAASGGNGKLVVAWNESTLAITGTINAYIVQHRQQNADATWPDWTDTEKSADDREHTFTGLADGNWQVRVRARNDAGDTDDSTHILGITSEIQEVTLAAANTNRPEPPSAAVAVPGQGNLAVEWHPPTTETGSIVYGYTVRHKIASAPDSAYVETTVIPRRVDIACEEGACKNPRTLEITGLGVGTDYTVQVQSLNANGGSDWLTVGSYRTYLDPRAPRNVRTEADNDLGIGVSWDAPAQGSPTGYVVEWWADDGSAAQTSALLEAGQNHYFIRGLDDGKAYTVRVAARDAEANDIYSPPAPPVTAWWEPLQAWFIDGTPQVNLNSGRIFLTFQANKALARGICIINGGPINCPSGSLISLDINPGGDYTVQARAIIDDETANVGLITVEAPEENRLQGPSYTRARASGGNGRLAVAWAEPAKSGTGSIEAYVVQHRQRNANGTWPGWTATEKSAADREHTFTGLADGTWQVRVRARSDGDDGDPGTTDAPRLGTPSEVMTVTLGSAHANLPGPPDDVVASADTGRIDLSWRPPANQTGSKTYGYTVRHKLSSAGDSAWVSRKVLLHSSVRAICNGQTGDLLDAAELFGCSKPGSLAITGLSSGTEYDVQIRSLNANGGSNWVSFDNVQVPANPKAPENVGTEADNDLGIGVSWDAPAQGSPLGYVVEWWPDGSAAQTSAPLDASQNHYFIRGLDDGKAYTVRVAALHAGDSAAAYSPPAPPVTTWWEPLQAWFIDGTPQVNLTIGRIFLTFQANKALARGICIINGGPINCPSGSLISLDINPGGDYTVQARAIIDDETANVGLITVEAPEENRLQGPSYTRARASGGNGRLAVAWAEPAKSGTGSIEAYVVQRRQQNANGTWPDWTATEKSAADREHTFTGLADGTWQVRVRARSDGDDGDPGTTDAPRLGTPSEAMTVTLGSSHANLPGPPRRRCGIGGHRQDRRELAPAGEPDRLEDLRLHGAPQAQQRRRQRLGEPEGAVALLRSRDL